MACIMGTILAGCIFSDIYPTNSENVCLYQVKHSQAKIIICDTYARLKSKFLVNTDEILKSGVKACILFADGVNENDVINFPQGPIPIYTWSQVINSVGSEIGNGVITKRIDA